MGGSGDGFAPDGPKSDPKSGFRDFLKFGLLIFLNIA